MLNLIGTGLNYLNYLFPIGRTSKFFKSGHKVINSTNPLIITKNITLIVVDCCAPPPVRFAAHCLAAGSLIAASAVSPNPFTFGATVHIVTEIYENC